MSVEKQLSGEEVHGGLQIEVFPMKASEYEKRFGFGKRLRDMRRECNYGLSDCKRALQECEGNIRRAIEQLDGIHLTKGKADKGWVGGVHVGRRRSSRRKASLSTEPTLGFGKDPEFKGVVECCAGSAGAEAGAATMDWMEQEQYREYSSDTYGSQVKTRGLVTPKPDMSMAAGGNMTQKIHEDPYGIDVWDLEHSSRVFVHLTNSQAWEGITGEKCPSTPVTAALYKKYGYKWYTHEAPGKAVGPTPAMKTIKTGQEVAEEHGSPFLPENESFGIPAHEIVNLVKDGNW